MGFPWGELYTLHSNLQPQAAPSAAQPDDLHSAPTPSAALLSAGGSGVRGAGSADEGPGLSASTPVPLSSVPLVSSICLSAAAVKAKELSLDEERKLLRCVAQLVQAQMRRVEIKLNHVQQLDVYLQQRQQDVHHAHTQLTHTQRRTMQMQQQQQQQRAANEAASHIASAAPAVQSAEAGKDDAEQGDSGGKRAASAVPATSSEAAPSSLFAPVGTVAASDTQSSVSGADGTSSSSNSSSMDTA